MTDYKTKPRTPDSREALIRYIVENIPYEILRTAYDLHKEAEAKPQYVDGRTALHALLEGLAVHDHQDEVFIRLQGSELWTVSDWCERDEWGPTERDVSEFLQGRKYEVIEDDPS